MGLASVTVTRRSETISRVTYSLKLTEAHKPYLLAFLSAIYFAEMQAIRPVSLLQRSYVIEVVARGGPTREKAMSTLLLLSLSPLQLINMEGLCPRTLHGKKRCPCFCFFPYLLLALW
jgi:hypothetical protein